MADDKKYDNVFRVGHTETGEIKEVTKEEWSTERLAEKGWAKEKDEERERESPIVEALETLYEQVDRLNEYKAEILEENQDLQKEEAVDLIKIEDNRLLVSQIESALSAIGGALGALRNLVPYGSPEPIDPRPPAHERKGTDKDDSVENRQQQENPVDTGEPVDVA